MQIVLRESQIGNPGRLLQEAAFTLSPHTVEAAWFAEACGAGGELFPKVDPLPGALNPGSVEAAEQPEKARLIVAGKMGIGIHEVFAATPN